MKSINQRISILLLGYWVVVLSGCGFVKEIESNKKRIATLEERVEELYKDGDSDGIVDFYDFEPETPEGILVDVRGRAIDYDEDGMPNHIDFDPFSTRGASVDERGRELDLDSDGVHDSRDLELTTPKDAPTDYQGRTIEMDAPLAAVSESKGPSWNLNTPPYAYLPDFNLAPPTDTEVLNHLLDSVETIGELCSMIENACVKANLRSLNYVEIPGVGFALISTGHRYSPVNGFNDNAGGYGLLNQPQFSILEIVDEIKYKVKQDARFRYFVFVIGFDWEKFGFIKGKTASTEALNLLLEPNKGIPEAVKKHKIYDGLFVQAVIYEFQVSGLMGDNVMLTTKDNKSFTAKEHLAKSGITKYLKP